MLQQFVLERELHRQLCLARIAHTLPQEAVKVEQSRRRQRIHVVLVVERIEHLDLGNQRVTFAELERTSCCPVEREVRVVFPKSVASAVLPIHKSRTARDWLRRMRLHPEVRL